MISVIIPVFQEEGNIGKLLHYLQQEADHPAIAEIIVVDGHSSDKTVKEARDAGVRVISASKKGRACQMNEGARLAKGSVLYFLHADTFPPETFPEDIQQAMTQKQQAGCFLLSFDDPHYLLALYSWFTRFRIKAFRFGDQSLFIAKELFERIGGFDESLIVMEDNEIFGRIMKYSSYSIIPINVITSSRKYKENGVIRLQFIYILIFSLFQLGVGQRKLKRLYKQWIRT
ncbi:MAG: TIGR04283 family arsenosugar biosynthesis glycosyltransferase [Balneolales bacterium]